MNKQDLGENQRILAEDWVKERRNLITGYSTNKRKIYLRKSETEEQDNRIIEGKYKK